MVLIKIKENWGKSHSIEFLIIAILSFFLLCFPLPGFTQIVKGHGETLRKVHVHSLNNQVIISAFKGIRYYSEKYNDLFNNIKVYRLSCPGFVFNKDYEEYFSNLDYKKGKLIFDGHITPELNSKFTYIDTTVEQGMVYAYWIGSSIGEPTGPVPVKVRNNDVWWTYKKIMKKMDFLKRKYPKYIKVEKIGYSVECKPMYGIKIGRGTPVLALVGAIHAGESGPELIIPILEKLLDNHSTLLDKISVVAIPIINIDNRNRLAHGVPWYIRKNHNGVDLNRNFPAGWNKIDSTYGYLTNDPDGLTFHGPFPASEPETQAVMKFLKKEKPHVVFSFHALASICGGTLLVSKFAKGDKEYVDQCYRFARRYWDGVDSVLYKGQKLVFGCDHGSLPNWCYEKLNIPAFDVESPPNPQDRAKFVYDKTDLPLLEKYQKRNFNGFINLLKSF